MLERTAKIRLSGSELSPRSSVRSLQQQQLLPPPRPGDLEITAQIIAHPELALMVNWPQTRICPMLALLFKNLGEGLSESERNRLWPLAAGLSDSSTDAKLAISRAWRLTDWAFRRLLPISIEENKSKLGAVHLRALAPISNLDDCTDPLSLLAEHYPLSSRYPGNPGERAAHAVKSLALATDFGEKEDQAERLSISTAGKIARYLAACIIDSAAASNQRRLVLDLTIQLFSDLLEPQPQDLRSRWVQADRPRRECLAPEKERARDLDWHSATLDKY